ncbi:sialidase family protein [Paractinoplanes globisporus]|uniref:Sialidase family protein n=1 Tax=Paractinoplanes globisporus TaxID=113565 RepID=A0ABW6W9I7_9ACTN|nr:sialidase family protein [Actinoplanes globisporus]
MHPRPSFPRTYAVSHTRIARLTAVAVPAVAAVLLMTAAPATANVALTQVSTDPYTDAQAQHQSEVEPDTYAFGSTIVSAFQVGRVSGGGASNIGWARSGDGGSTWTRGYLPGITTNGGGTFGQASDAAVAFDARHNVWLISSLGISGSTVNVLTSRSTNGGLTWTNPVTTATGANDKNWIVCDNTATSAFFGNCYTEYDITSSGDSIRMKTSTNGGATWGAALAPGGSHTGLGGQPVVLPNGHVLVPYLSLSDTIRSFRSTNGGTSWNSTVQVSTISHHDPAGNLREETLPSAEADAAGTVYVSWSDCRFRSGCPSNDIVVAKSTSETTWAAPTRVPIDATSSTVDHFVPGIGVDRSTSGTSARIGLTYYYYPAASCTAATCVLDVGFISSTNGGSSWSSATALAGPMNLSWIPNTSQGRMFGDYISTSVLNGGNAYPVLAVATAPTGSTLHLGMSVPAGGMAITGGTNTAAVPAAPTTQHRTVQITAR